MKYRVILSCEHAGHFVPENYLQLFAGADEVLKSHRGWDPGALDIAKFLSTNLNVPLFYETTTRLLIEMNRSLDNPELFSEFSKQMDEAGRNELIENYYLPYRLRIENSIKDSNKPVLHLSVHTFTPVSQNSIREADIGLLFDPDRNEEQEFCQYLHQELKHLLPGFSIRFNEPYSGADDGLTTALRKKFPGSDYLGIELEINQKFINTASFLAICQALCESVRVTTT